MRSRNLLVLFSILNNSPHLFCNSIWERDPPTYNAICLFNISILFLTFFAILAVGISARDRMRHEYITQKCRHKFICYHFKHLVLQSLINKGYNQTIESTASHTKFTLITELGTKSCILTVPSFTLCLFLQGSELKHNSDTSAGYIFKL